MEKYQLVKNTICTYISENIPKYFEITRVVRIIQWQKVIYNLHNI